MMRGTWESESIFHTYSPSHVPAPYAWGNYASDPNAWFYLCAFHDMSDAVPDARAFVSVVSKIHKESLGKNSQYGFHVPTHLANLPNDNTWQDTWTVWFTQAMRQMFALEEASHGQDDELDLLKEALYSKVIPRLLHPLESGGRTIKPCLIHSDLWPGNSKPDASTGQVMIFDSCAFWGHNEADLGSWRAPRYRMGGLFLEEYKRVMGMSEPEEDWDDRNALYAM